MDIGVLRRDDIPETELSELAGGSLLGSAVFARVWESLGGSRAVWIGREGGRIKAAMPGVEFGIGPMRRFYAMPDGLYARLLGGEGGEFMEAGRELMTGIAGQGYAKAFLYDFFEEIGGHDEFQKESYRTTLVDVAPGWEPPDRKLRGEIRRAEREGVTVEALDWRKHGQGFMELVARGESERGSARKYPSEFFSSLAGAARESETIRWYWCEHEGKAAASHIYFVEGDMMLGWQMFYDRELAAAKANQFLIATAVRELTREGVTRLNLGASPAEAEGTEFFKRRWGGYEYTYSGYIQKKGLGRVL